MRGVIKHGIHVHVLPVSTVCHQRGVLFLGGTAPVTFGGLTVNFRVFQVRCALHVELRLELGRGGLDHGVLGADREVGLVFSEQVSSAAALATEFLARGRVDEGVAKDIAIEGELASLGGGRVCSVAEDAAGEGVASTHLDVLVGRHTAGLDRAPLSVLVVEYVRVLVGGSGRLGL